MGLLGIFSKKKQPSSTVPPLPDIGEDLPELPPIEDTELPPLEEEPEEMPVPEPPRKAMPGYPMKEMQIPKPAMEKEEPHPAEMTHHFTQGGSIFLNVDDYKHIMDSAEGVKAKISDAEDILRKLHQLKEQKNEELRKWQMTVADMQRKLAYVDKTLFEK